MKSHAIIFTTILSAAAYFWLLPRAQAVVPPRMEVMPGSTRQRGTWPFLASLPALGMWQLAGLPSIATLKAALTPLSAQEHCFSIPQIKIPPPAQERFYSTIVVQTIRETGHLRCIPMPPARKMQPLVLARFTRMTRMQPVWPTTTRHLALLPSNLTLMAVRTRRWAQGRDKT